MEAYVRGSKANRQAPNHPMKKNTRMRYFILAQLFTQAAAQAGIGRPAGTSAKFLLLNPDPRTTAMAEAGAMVENGAFAAHGNPAGLTRLKNAELTILRNQFLQDVNQDFIGMGRAVGFGGLALSSVRLETAPFPSYDATGSRTGSVTTQDLSLALSAGGKTPFADLDAGASLKFIRQTLASRRASGWAADFGVTGKIRPLWRWGACFSHIGAGLKFDNERAPLPALARLGVLRQDGFRSRLIAGADADFGQDQSMSFGAGGQWRITRGLAGRAGYRFSAPERSSGLRAGFGLEFGNIQLDYAWSAHPYFESAHRLGVTILFWPASKTAPLSFAGKI